MSDSDQVDLERDDQLRLDRDPGQAVHRGAPQGMPFNQLDDRTTSRDLYPAPRRLTASLGRRRRADGPVVEARAGTPIRVRIRLAAQTPQ
jgi:hypothetical protein